MEATVAHPLDGVRLKLTRAEEHLHILDDETARYLDGDFFQLVRDDTAHGSVFHLWVKEQPPARLSLLLGDCLHNLRSSLDHLAWQLVIANANSPDERTKFPVHLNRPSKDLFASSSVRGMSREAITIIEKLQPYQAGDRANQTALWFVGQLSNHDKHRTLNLTAASLKGMSVRLLDHTGQTAIATAIIPGGMFRHGAKVAPFEHVNPARAYSEDMKVEATGEAFVMLQEPGPWGDDQPITLLLVQALEVIRNEVLPPFARFFPV